jgi:hypothetical protein
MRAILLTLLIGIAAVSAACWPDWLLGRHDEVEFTFDNRTDSLLCVYPYPDDASAGRCLAEVRPRAETGWTPGCAYGTRGEVDRSPVTVVLTLKEGGRQIYQRTASCRTWNETDRKFVIEQRGDEFSITDPLQDATSGP